MAATANLPPPRTREKSRPRPISYVAPRYVMVTLSNTVQPSCSCFGTARRVPCRTYQNLRSWPGDRLNGRSSIPDSSVRGAGTCRLGHLVRWPGDLPSLHHPVPRYPGRLADDRDQRQRAARGGRLNYFADRERGGRPRRLGAGLRVYGRSCSGRDGVAGTRGGPAGDRPRTLGNLPGQGRKRRGG